MPYSDMRDRDREMNMMHYPGTVRRLSIVDSRKPWYDESRHATDPGSPAERLSAMNASRSVERAQPMFEHVRPANEDVFFDLIEQDKVAWGQPFNLQVHIQVGFFLKFLFNCQMHFFLFLSRIVPKRCEPSQPTFLPILSITLELLLAVLVAMIASSFFNQEAVS